ncbi:hypothetical protein BP6252_03661 [Coleophoma cylindrospora]|uniref:Uncharacterized protein n=1 Tax=Coleophoma cylindrospora TaxID=1849047 RepID=A0A3D8S898_9HELO|nr:hypothetical protein BP6252_03661 [Coleophoma cylindrospora]
MNEKLTPISEESQEAHFLALQEPGHDPNLPGPKGRPVLSEDEIEVESESLAAGEDSIYPEVRASVPPFDEDLPVNTFRAWFLGVFWIIVLCGLNQFFQMHNPPIGLSAYLIILLSLPCGRVMAQYLPTRQWSFFGHSFTLNPGPFNRKEHTIIAIMGIGVSSFDNGSVASDVWTSLITKFGIPISTGYKLMFLLTSQALCFGMAGIFSKILVDPAYCIWPANLPTCSLLYGMHDKHFQDQIANGWKVSRMNFFWVVLAGATLYQFIPGYVFTGLTTFAWVTWIAPNNVPLNQVFGATTGMDLLPLTLDWNQITGYLSSPLMIPTWAILNCFAGSVFFLWIVAPALHWTNVWDGMYMPFSSSGTFDNTGASYNTSRILNADFTLNEEAYHAYSPIYLSTTSILSYGLGFGAVTSVIVHAFLNHRIEIWNGLKATWKSDTALEKDDIHTKLMQKYRSVPVWWYLATFLLMTGLTILFVEYFDTGLPWWGVILSIVINLIVIIPTGIMSALCNVSVSTNIFAALLGGFIWPGRMVAVVIFKIMTFNTTATALIVLRDMKLGHYMKIPPRTVFLAQIVGILVSWLVQSAVNIWALSNVQGICTAEATGGFQCPLASAYKTSIIFWGLIGPQKLFSSGALYTSMLSFFAVGAVAPVVVWWAGRVWPGRLWGNIHIPLILSSTGAIPPATAGNYIPWAIVGLLFNYYIKNRYAGWWAKYNYLLSAALDAGLAITTFFIFFCLYYPGVSLNWWGNVTVFETADALGLPLRMVAEGDTFGRKTW